jgi:hypothetical protein
MPGFLFIRFSHQNRVYTPLLSPYMLHTLPFLFSLILLPEQYWVSTDH